MRLKQLKHLKHKIASIVLQHMQHQIIFCNVQMKHMQHISKTHKTCSCNMCSSTCCTTMEARSHGARRRRGARGRPWSTHGWITAWREPRGARREARRVRLVLWHEARGVRAHEARGAGAGASVPSRKDGRPGVSLSVFN
jgi:hypothetical protein